MITETVEFAGEPGSATVPIDDLFDLTGIPEPEPFRAPKFQDHFAYGTYVEAREPQFRTHATYGHAKRALTMSNSRLFGGGTQALSNSVIYTHLEHGDSTREWVPVETYPAGAELPWRTRSSQS